MEIRSCRKECGCPSSSTAPRLPWKGPECLKSCNREKEPPEGWTENEGGRKECQGPGEWAEGSCVFGSETAAPGHAEHDEAGLCLLVEPEAQVGASWRGEQGLFRQTAPSPLSGPLRMWLSSCQLIRTLASSKLGAGQGRRSRWELRANLPFGHRQPWPLTLSFNRRFLKKCAPCPAEGPSGSSAAPGEAR